tara:strand:+ start:1197 stop:2678 length:1482 start_codon:yes stop_codon:yes gene_type:complete
MKILIFFFNDVIKDAYWDHDDVILFNGKGWWIRNGASRELVPQQDLIENDEIFSDGLYQNLIEKLRAWGPTWARWCGRGDQQELLLRKAALQCMSISLVLRNLNISTCIMHTGLSHHLDSVIFEYACEFAGIDRIYLYSQNISGRLLPLVQNGSIKTRLRLGATLSDFDETDNTIRFIDRTKVNLPPEIGGMDSHSDIDNFWRALLHVLSVSAIKSFRRLLSIGYYKFLSHRSKPGDIFSYLYNQYPFQDLFQIIQQRQGLHYLNRHLKAVECPDSSFVGSNTPKLLILAHYQPEASSFPEGWEYGNHIDIVIAIRSKGYNGNVFYKEHPASSLYVIESSTTRVGMCRSRNYYEQLGDLGCKFIKDTPGNKYGGASCDTFMPITIVGTVAIERALNGLCTIVVGYPWFREMPGVISFSEIKSLEDIDPSWMVPNPAIAEAAFDFMVNELSNKTITNAPGIGNGVQLTDEDSLRSFRVEFDALLSFLFNPDRPK